MIRSTLLATLSLAAMPAAGDFALQSPIACDLTRTCHVQQGVDHDDGPGAQDFTCGSLTYDGHKGTDFALPSLALLNDGIAVTASAPGTVRGVRNDMVDALQGQPGAPDVADRECGNGVVIAHAGGWETQYCHLRQGSVSVTSGQTVTAGDTLGLVGLSGQTEFPHVHLSVRKDGAVVDPFAPDATATCGDAPTRTLWADDVTFAPGGLIAAGFADAVPDYDAVKAGTAAAGAMATDAAALVLWGFGFGLRVGDTLTLTITGPDGLVFDDTQTVDRTQAQAFRAGGRRTPAGGWAAGDYTGTVVMRRGGDMLDTQTAQITLD